MKKLLFLLVGIALTKGSICQEQKLSGIYTEYKRTLWNGEDGAKYTYNKQPFKATIQFVFKDNSNDVTVYYESNDQEQTYTISKDTLIFKMVIGKGEHARAYFTKYLIVENNTELILQEVKPGLNEKHYLKKYFFKKNAELDKSYLKKPDHDIFTVVEKMPDYPGGTEEMKKFIAGEVAKSTLNQKQNVFVQLLINPQGKIEEADILNAVKVEYAEEAMNIVRKMPDFTPGSQNGKAVYVFENIPIRFLEK